MQRTFTQLVPNAGAADHAAGVEPEHCQGRVSPRASAFSRVGGFPEMSAWFVLCLGVVTSSRAVFGFDVRHSFSRKELGQEMHNIQVDNHSKVVSHLKRADCNTDPHVLQVP